MKNKLTYCVLLMTLALGGCSDEQSNFSYAVKINSTQQTGNQRPSVIQKNLINALVWADRDIFFYKKIPTRNSQTLSGKTLDLFYPGWFISDLHSLENRYISGEDVSKKYVFLTDCVVDEKVFNEKSQTESYLLCKSDKGRDLRPKLYFQYFDSLALEGSFLKKGLQQLYFCRFDGFVAQHLSFSDCLRPPFLRLRISQHVQEEMAKSPSIKKIVSEVEKQLTHEEKLACNNDKNCYDLMKKGCFNPFIRAAQKVNEPLPNQLSEKNLKIICK